MFTNHQATDLLGRFVGGPLAGQTHYFEDKLRAFLKRQDDLIKNLPYPPPDAKTLGQTVIKKGVPFWDDSVVNLLVGAIGVPVMPYHEIIQDVDLFPIYTGTQEFTERSALLDTVIKRYDCARIASQMDLPTKPITPRQYVLGILKHGQCLNLFQDGTVLGQFVLWEVSPKQDLRYGLARFFFKNSALTGALAGGLSSALLVYALPSLFGGNNIHEEAAIQMISGAFSTALYSPLRFYLLRSLPIWPASILTLLGSALITYMLERELRYYFKTP